MSNYIIFGNNNYIKAHTVVFLLINWTRFKKTKKQQKNIEILSFLIPLDLMMIHAETSEMYEKLLSVLSTKWSKIE